MIINYLTAASIMLRRVQHGQCFTVILLREGHVSSHSNISYFLSFSRCVTLTIFVLEYSEKYQDYISGLNY